MREALARAMFDRQAGTYGAHPAMSELAWVDPGVRAFWLAEADHVLDFVASYQEPAHAGD